MDSCVTKCIKFVSTSKLWLCSPKPSIKRHPLLPHHWLSGHSKFCSAYMFTITYSRSLLLKKTSIRSHTIRCSDLILLKLKLGPVIIIFLSISAACKNTMYRVILLHQTHFHVFSPFYVFLFGTNHTKTHFSNNQH